MPKYDATRSVTLNASKNKLYFKYVTIPSEMVIAKGGGSTTTVAAGSIFTHKLIHQIETDLSVSATFTGSTDPDKITFDTTGGDIVLSGLDVNVFGLTSKTLAASDNTCCKCLGCKTKHIHIETR